MKERPILFSGPMVRAILAGTKTQTRRVMKPVPCLTRGMQTHEFSVGGHDYRCPYGVPGSRLWVRETFAMNEVKGGPPVIYRADYGQAQSVFIDRPHSAEWDVVVTRWKPSIFMPRSASRILLEITEVRVERLQAISDDDAWAEGCEPNDNNPVDWYHALWEQINGAGSWDANPWVWVVSFKRLQP
jgi:hypothetical protein